jgi:16S rRNA (cytidine1402-2'-O)-methyltransferase
LTVAGLPTDRFMFLGFLPAKAKARSDAIAEVAEIRATLVLYESGQRLADTLLALSAGLGQRDAAIVREITKLHEECVTGTLGELATRYADDIPRGEIVIVVGPPVEAEAVSDDVIDAMLDKALRRLSPSRAAAEVAEQLNIPRKRAYARALDRAR